MHDKKGMVLVESLLLFMIVVILVGMVFGVAQQMRAMEQVKEKGLHNEAMREI